MSKFDELKRVCEITQAGNVDFTINSTQILELLAIQAQLVEALKVLTERAMGFNVSGVYFGEMTEDRILLDNACDAIDAAGAQS